YSYSDIKRTVMDQFITKHQNFVLAIVLNHFGKDQNLVDKVGEGFSKGLFELTIHGWDHVKFPLYSLEQQKAWLESSNSKLKDMFVYYCSDERSMCIKIPIETVVNDIDWAITKYGYAVVVMHPPDFARMVDGKPTREVAQSQIDDLNYIIDTELAKGRFTTTYSK